MSHKLSFTVLSERRLTFSTRPSPKNKRQHFRPLRGSYGQSECLTRASAAPLGRCLRQLVGGAHVAGAASLVRCPAAREGICSAMPSPRLVALHTRSGRGQHLGGFPE